MWDELAASRKVKHVFKALTGEVGFRFAGHSDISCDKVVFWHKDKLNGKYASYQQLSPWSEGGEHKIYKLLLYLQDHSNDSEALRVVPGSHLESEVTLKGVHYAQLHPKLGDALVIDQRVTHTGQMRVQGSPHRILVSLGFGANNIWTDQFQAGTEARQAADTEAMRSRATQPSWQRDSMRVLHDNILRPALGMVYSGFSPLRVLKLASRTWSVVFTNDQWSMYAFDLAFCPSIAILPYPKHCPRHCGETSFANELNQALHACTMAYIFVSE
eukprot:1555811-Amphidinium_carterae.1